MIIKINRNPFLTCVSLLALMLSFSLTTQAQCPTSSGTILNVTAFGADIADNANDDTPAIQAALDAANSGDTVYLPNGIYNIDGTLSFDGQNIVNDLTFMGEDEDQVRLKCNDWEKTLYFEKSTNLTIKNFSVDWNENLPFSYGVVKNKGIHSSSANSTMYYYDLELVNGQTPRAGLYTEAIMQFDSNLMRPHSDELYDVYQRNQNAVNITSQNINNRLRIFSRDGRYTVNEEVIARHKVYGANIIVLRKVDDIQIENITVYSAPGMGVHARHCSDISVDNFDIRRENGHWMSITADGVHFDSNRGYINVVDSFMEGMGDDGLNIHSKYLPIGGFTPNVNNTGNISLWLPPIYQGQAINEFLPQMGDSIVFVNPDNFEVLGVSEVVTQNPNYNVRWVTDFGLPSGVDLRDYVIYNKNLMPSTLIDGFTVKKCRARGALIQTSNVTVQNSTFEECSSSAIQLTASTGAYFIESASPKNVTIQNCVFDGCNYGPHRRESPLMLFTQATNSNNENMIPGIAGTIRNIKIANNEFINIWGDDYGIFMASASDVCINNNTFAYEVLTPVLPLTKNNTDKAIKGFKFAPTPAHYDASNNNDVSSIYVNTGDCCEFGDFVDIPLNAGWNMISSNILPECPNMEAIFEDIEDKIIQVKDLYGTYVPTFNLNSIGDWDITKGYQVKTTEACTLRITGAKVNPFDTPIAMNAGWNMISYLPSEEADPACVLEDLATDIIQVKNLVGSYAPNFGINSMGLMAPTQGYMVKCENPTTLNYELAYKETPQAIFDPLPTNPNNATLTIIDTHQSLLQDGDMVNIYSSDGIWVGSTTFQSMDFSMLIYGNEENSKRKIALENDEAFTLKVIRPTTQQQFEAILNFIEGPETFKSDAMSLATIEKLEPISSLLENIIVEAYPNPTTDLFNIHIQSEINQLDKELQLQVFTLDGQLIQQLPFQSNQILKYETSSLKEGTYFYTILSDSRLVYSDKFMVFK